jgi:hypothetical protein
MAAPSTTLRVVPLPRFGGRIPFRKGLLWERVWRCGAFGSNLDRVGVVGGLGLELAVFLGADRVV